jgi:hypothetical protein
MCLSLSKSIDKLGGNVTIVLALSLITHYMQIILNTSTNLLILVMIGDCTRAIQVIKVQKGFVSLFSGNVNCRLCSGKSNLSYELKSYILFTSCTYAIFKFIEQLVHSTITMDNLR